MAVKHNNQLHKNHFHKYWQRHIRTWFNQPMRKKRRAQKRLAKAAAMAPRPIHSLKPIVHCCTRRYNGKLRLGRGFSLDELRAVGLNPKYARTIGIAVDHRRKNRSLESLQLNVERLKEYKSRLILFPIKAGKPKLGDASESEQALAVQVKGKVLPINYEELRKDSPMILTEKMKNFKAYRTLRRARYGVWRKGRNDKKARDAAAAKK